MAAEMCEIHPFEMGDDWCGDCGRSYCSECIVYAFGPKKPPLCRACAIARSGVRKHAARPPVASRRTIRREARQRRRDAKRAQQAPAESPPVAPPAPEPVPVAAAQPEPVEVAAAYAEPAAYADPAAAPAASYGPEPAAAPTAAAIAAAPPPPDMFPEPGAGAPLTGASIIEGLPYATDDEPELREVRPSFESRLTRRRL